MKKRHLITVLAAAAAMLAVPATAEAKSFQDVKSGDWFYNTVSAISEKGIMTGMTDTIFGPGNNLSRAQFATVLYRMAGSPEVTYQQHFPDVPDGQWYSKPVVWMYEQEIAGGYADGNFGPADEITREQMAKIMYAYQSYMGYDVSNTTSLENYPDAGLVSEFAKEYMEWAVADGIISGQDNGEGQAKTLSPQTQASRGVTATIISRVLKPFEGKYVISASEAKEKIGNPNVIFIDGRGVAQDAETIKGAVINSWQDWSVKMNGSSQTGAPGWWKIMDAVRLNTTLGNLGLSKEKEIILLGETKTGWGDDARLMWELRAAGYENVTIVDGGYRMLAAVGAPTQKGTSKLARADAKVSSIDETHLINTDRLKADYAKYKVIDTRTDAEYEGQKLYNEKSGGHLPGAAHLRYTDLFFDDGTLRPVRELTKWFESAGLSKDDRVVTYCTAGIRSSYMQVILEMCGFEHTYNYDESFWGWTETDGTVE